MKIVKKREIYITRLHTFTNPQSQQPCPTILIKDLLVIGKIVLNPQSEPKLYVYTSYGVVKIFDFANNTYAKISHKTSRKATMLSGLKSTARLCLWITKGIKKRNTAKTRYFYIHYKYYSNRLLCSGLFLHHTVRLRKRKLYFVNLNS